MLPKGDLTDSARGPIYSNACLAADLGKDPSDETKALDEPVVLPHPV